MWQTMQQNAAAIARCTPSLELSSKATSPVLHGNLRALSFSRAKSHQSTAGELCQAQRCHLPQCTSCPGQGQQASRDTHACCRGPATIYQGPWELVQVVAFSAAHPHQQHLLAKRPQTWSRFTAADLPTCHSLHPLCALHCTQSQCCWLSAAPCSFASSAAGFLPPFTKQKEPLFEADQWAVDPEQGLLTILMPVYPRKLELGYLKNQLRTYALYFNASSVKEFIITTPWCAWGPAVLHWTRAGSRQGFGLRFPDALPDVCFLTSNDHEHPFLVCLPLHWGCTPRKPARPRVQLYSQQCQKGMIITPGRLQRSCCWLCGSVTAVVHTTAWTVGCWLLHCSRGPAGLHGAALFQHCWL